MKAPEACDTVFGGGSFGGFLTVHKASPGEPISVEVNWDEKDFSGKEVELVGCVNVDEAMVDRLATRVRRVDNDGSHRLAFVVPSDAEPGAKLCQRTAVLGVSNGTPKLIKNRAVCYQVTAAGEAEEHAAGSSEVKKTEVVTAPASGPPAPEVAGKTETRAAAGAKSTESESDAAPEAAPARTEAAASDPEALPRTGSAERALVFLAGLLFALGGFAAMFGTRRARIAG